MPGPERRRLAIQGLAMLGVSALAALGIGMCHPRPPEWDGPERVSLAAIRSDAGPWLWIDARPVAAWRTDGLPDAIRIDEGTWETGLGAILERWQPGIRIVVYCDASRCGSGRRVARRLQRDLDLPVLLLDGDHRRLLRGGGL